MQPQQRSGPRTILISIKVVSPLLEQEHFLNRFIVRSILALPVLLEDLQLALHVRAHKPEYGSQQDKKSIITKK